VSKPEGVAVLFACEPLLSRKLAGLPVLDRAAVAAGWFRMRGKAVPPALLRAERMLTRVPEGARARIAAALSVLHLELHPVFFDGRYPAPTTPVAVAYPRAPLRFQARLVLGERPADLLPGLSAREAHEGLTLGFHSSVDYLLRDAPVTMTLGSGVRDIRVARWICACLADPPRRQALLRESTERGPHGEWIRGVLASRVDEIEVEDLPCGSATGVAAAFRSAARRAWQRWQGEAETQHELLATPPEWWTPIRCARLLGSAAELVAEGRQMGHCVGSYSIYVKRGISVVVSIVVPDCRPECSGEPRASGLGLLRSTVEIERHTGKVLQHRGLGNGYAPDLCEKALRVCLKRWGNPSPEGTPGRR